MSQECMLLVYTVQCDWSAAGQVAGGRV